MSDSPAGRKAVNAHTTPFLPYDMEGPVQPEMSWLPVSYDDETEQGTYLMRMEPGAVTIAHDHAGMEEFLVLEGDLVDSDGTTFGPGDFVSYEAGTHHNSWTEGGCLIAVFEWREPELASARPGSRYDGDAGEADGLQRIFARPESATSQISVLRNEKGGVVRRPFSKLQALADCRQSPAGSRTRYRHAARAGLESLDARISCNGRGTERDSRQAPAHSVPGKLLRGGTAPSPLSDLTRATAASLPAVSDRTLVDSPTVGVTQGRLTDPPTCVDLAT